MSPRAESPLELTPPVLVGLLVAVAGVDRLPSRPWPLDEALECVETELGPADSPLRRACVRLAKGRGGVGPKFEGLAAVVRDLARAGHMTPEGRGWNAAYVAAPVWLAAHAELATHLDRADRRVLTRGAQRLKAALRTWSKNAVASAPTG